MSISKRIEKLERQTTSGEPVTIHLHKRIIDMDGEIQSERTRVIHLRAVGVQSCPLSKR